MNCKSFGKHIAPFIEYKGEIKDVKEFIKHFDSCKQCREEFESDFYAYWGLKMLNNPDVDSYNIADELNKTLLAARQKIKYDKYVLIGFILIILAACGLLGFFLWYY